MKEWIVGLSVAVGLSGVTCVGGGCWAPPGPITEFKINPVSKTASFRDTKDNHIKLQGLEFSATEKSGKLQLLEIENSASAVIAMQIKQMEVWNTQMATANEGITRVLSGLERLLEKVMPAVQAQIEVNQTRANKPNMAEAVIEVTQSTERTVRQLNPVATSQPSQ